MTEDKKWNIRCVLEKNRSVLWVLLLGAVLMLLPGTARTESTERDTASFDTDEEKLAVVLGQIEGAGAAWVLLQQPEEDHAGGAVVVCSGAESARVRLQIVQAVSAYTGLGSDRIIVLKMQS